MDVLLTREELLRWRPYYGDKYYTFKTDSITGFKFVVEAIWRDSIVDVSLLKAGWVFQTKAQAKLELLEMQPTKPLTRQ